MRTGRDVVVGALLGADEFGFATGPLVVLGCTLLRRCHTNTCSVGIATQDEALRKRFSGKPEHVETYFRFVAEQVREIMAGLGFRTFDQLIGRVDRLKVRQDIAHWKAEKLDLSAILAEPQTAATGRRILSCQVPQELDLTDHLDHVILERAKDFDIGATSARVKLPVTNADRAVGAHISGLIAAKHGGKGLADDTLHVQLTGSAGQSFGAFLARGVTLKLEGEANDYLGKGLSGGRIVVYPPRNVRFVPEENIIIGNTVLYGATAGELFARGVAGERFAVRNSGARAVVEGVGDHGCEYMTGGVVVVLGSTGRNFAAGMSGGMAFVYDDDQTFRARCNRAMVELQPLSDDSDVWLVQKLLDDHQRYTGSTLAKRILDNWEAVVESFIKIMPIEYKRVLQERRAKAEREAVEMAG
jgi:glutamate synthase (NADPH/NADH) large chain